MYGRTIIFVEFFMLTIYQKCWKFFMCLIFVGQGYPRKLFNLEHFPIYGISVVCRWYVGFLKSGHIAISSCRKI